MDYVERGWSLIEDFYRWLLDKNFSLFQSGIYCKYIATFFDLFMKKFFYGEVDLKDISKEILREYLGYWYPMNATFASVDDIKMQIESFKMFCEFLERIKNAKMDMAFLFLENEDRIVNRFKSYMKIKRDCIDFSKFEEDLKEWLMEEW